MEVVKVFRIKDKVTDVGLRPKLLAEANRRRLRIAVRNISDNEVEVVVAGNLINIDEFYIEACNQIDAQCTPLESYPYYIDWDACYQGLVAEQMAKFVEHGKRIEDTLGEIKNRLNSMDTKLESMDTKLESMDTKLNSMNTKLNSVDTKLNKLDSIEKILLRIEKKLG